MADVLPTETTSRLRPGDILHVGMALLWIGFTIYGVAVDATAVAIAVWALAAGFHIGTLAQRHG